MLELLNGGKKKPVANLTRLLMHLDGNSIDECGNAIATQTGVSYVDGQKFGRKGAAFTKNGYIALVPHSRLVLSGDFTVEFVATFAIPTTISENVVMCAQPGQFFDLLVAQPGYNGGKPCILASLSVANDQSNRTTLDTPWLNNGPHHFALTRKNGVATFWLDGVSKASAPMTIPWGSLSTSLFIGNLSSPAYAMGGTLQEVRISEVVRYNANFTPSATPFVVD